MTLKNTTYSLKKILANTESINYFILFLLVLCSSPDDLYNNKEIHIFMQSLKTNQENFVELHAEWRNIAINLEEDPKTFNITSKSPATGKKQMP